jgi:hypothetical protein
VTNSYKQQFCSSDLEILIKRLQHSRVTVGKTTNISHSMGILVRFNIKFIFDRGKTISYVCQREEYDVLCKELSS